MFTVTEAALDRLSWKLANRKAADEMAMRFAEKEGGWRLRLDHQGPDDTVFAHRGRNVLLVDKAVVRTMSDRTLDARNTAGGPRLILR
jgi:hypothetical protein